MDISQSITIPEPNYNHLRNSASQQLNIVSSTQPIATSNPRRLSPQCFSKSAPEFTHTSNLGIPNGQKHCFSPETFLSFKQTFPLSEETPPSLNYDSMKERIKKENHNKIERRRRGLINERIKELGALLGNRLGEGGSRLNKGGILKASCDYFQEVQKIESEHKMLFNSLKETQTLNRKLLRRVQELEMACQSQSIPVPCPDPEIATFLAKPIINLTPTEQSPLNYPASFQSFQQTINNPFQTKSASPVIPITMTSKDEIKEEQMASPISFYSDSLSPSGDSDVFSGITFSPPNLQQQY